MPRKKRCASKASKGELLFTEAPKEGRVYHYGSSFHSVDNPKCVPTKPVKQADTAWIIPQFESDRSLDIQTWNSNPQNFKKKDANQTVPKVSGRRWKPSAHKFSPLIFENVRSPCIGEDSGCSLDFGGQAGHFETRCNQADAVASIRHPWCMENASSCGVTHYANVAAFSPPDISTPEQTSNSSPNECLPQVDSFTPGATRGLSCEDTSDDIGDSSVLVQDTPEHEYGVKVTWRSRPHLVKLLRKRGLLNTRDILVETNMSAACVEANGNI